MPTSKRTCTSRLVLEKMRQVLIQMMYSAQAGDVRAQSLVELFINDGTIVIKQTDDGGQYFYFTR